MTTVIFFLMPAPTTLYDSNFAAVVILPAGYFVMQSDEQTQGEYIPVVYDDLSGFVKKSDVRAVDYRPVTKYETTVRFRCDNDGQPVNLRSAPQKNASIISVLAPTDSGRCYGYMTGDALITGGETLWYYVSINGARGYCYYAHVTVDNTPPNIIEKEPEEIPTDVSPADEEEQEILPTAATIILIVALCVPVPFIMFYLFKKKKE